MKYVTGFRVTTPGIQHDDTNTGAFGEREHYRDPGNDGLCFGFPYCHKKRKKNSEMECSWDERTGLRKLTG